MSFPKPAGDLAIGIARLDTFNIARHFRFAPQVRTDGITSFTKDVRLRRNALVRAYDLVVRADQASATAVENVAQVRATPGAGDAPASIVLDFGTLRTVSGVLVKAPMSIGAIFPWIGASFAKESVFPADGEKVFTADGSTRQEVVVLRKEIRTERLLVEVKGTPAEGELWSTMSVVLPEAPTDLEIRIDGGPPVVTFPGPAQPGEETALTDRGWNKNGFRIVHLADALSKLTGDPTNSEEVTFKVVLSSRVPGELDMQVPPVDPETVGPLGAGVKLGPPVTSFIRRMLFDGETTKEIVFFEEGLQQVPLDMPPTRQIEEIAFTLTGTLPPERVVPPIGPDIPVDTNDRGLADLLLNRDHAACVRLRSDTRLAELIGIRLPLVVGGEGAEARIVLWRPADNAAQEPFEAMPDGVSEPVTLEGTDTDSEIWTTFSFKNPVPINSEAPPWAALLVSRGQATWKLGAVTGEDDPIAAHVIRRGAPTGPWKPLPKPFQDPTSPLSLVRGRLRAIGYSPKDKPLAPLVVGVGQTTIEVSPTPKGASYRLRFSPRVMSTNLQVVSRVAGNVTLRDLDVVTTT